MIEPVLQDEAWCGDVESASVGDAGVHLWWLGQMGFLLKTLRCRILLDPYLSDSLTRKYADTDKPHVRMTRRVVDPARLQGIDVVTASHAHTDHLDAETLRPLVAANPRVRLVCPESIRVLARERSGLPDTQIVGLDVENDGMIPSRCVGDGWEIEAVPAAHETLERDRSGRLLCLGYVIRCGGRVIYHAGDTVPYAGMEERLSGRGVDVALLPINGRRAERRVAGNLWGREAAALARAMGAGLAIPGHFEMFAFNTESPDEFVSECGRLGQVCRVMRAGEGIRV